MGLDLLVRVEGITKKSQSIFHTKKINLKATVKTLKMKRNVTFQHGNDQINKAMVSPKQDLDLNLIKYCYIKMCSTSLKRLNAVIKSKGASATFKAMHTYARTLCMTINDLSWFIFYGTKTCHCNRGVCVYFFISAVHITVTSTLLTCYSLTSKLAVSALSCPSVDTSFKVLSFLNRFLYNVITNNCLIVVLQVGQNKIFMLSL